MKKVLCLLVATVVVLCSCGTSKRATIIEGISTEDYYVGTGTGWDQDSHVAYELARTEALNKLAEQINQSINSESVREGFSSSNDGKVKGKSRLSTKVVTITDLNLRDVQTKYVGDPFGKEKRVKGVTGTEYKLVVYISKEKAEEILTDH